jgi:group II intron reverse transcriptase/maturase
MWYKQSVYSYSTAYQGPEGAEVTAKGLKELRQVSKRSQDRNWVHEKLFSLFRFDDLWVTAYGKLATSSRSKTAGVDNITINGTTRKKIMNVKDEILQGDFTWTDIKRVVSAKANERLCPLGFLSFKDRLVQEIIRMILNEIYEPHFKEVSHGFRPGKSQHTALREVRKSFKGCIWTIEGDISKFFDSVNHDILLNLLKKKIQDNRFLSLIEKGLKSRVILPAGLKKNTGMMGPPLALEVNYLLSNIYLDVLDQWVIEYKNSFDKVGPRSGSSSAYRNEYDNMLKQAPVDPSQIRSSGQQRADPQDPFYRRLEYVRYGDDFLIGLICTKEEAEKVKEDLKSVLWHKLKLQLNQEKTVLTHWRDDVPFLGYKIRQLFIQTQVKVQNKTPPTRRKVLMLLCDRKKVVKKLHRAGFCGPSGIPTPNFCFLHQTQELSNRIAIALLEGLNSYYKLADDRQKSITYLAYIVKMSLAKMYAAKFRLGTSKQVFKRAGRDLSRPCAAIKTASGTQDKNRAGNSAQSKTSAVARGRSFGALRKK